MKQSLVFFISVFLLSSFSVFSQGPSKINFQSILRNTTGEIVSNKSVSIKMSILRGTINGTLVYVETHVKTTDVSGLISIKLGTGTVINGIFGDIEWGSASHFIQLEVDFNGGSNYVVIGTQELISVPYALYANKTDTTVLNLASRFSTKLNVTDTASLSNRIDTKLNVTDTAILSNRIDTKLNVTDTAILSNRIDAKLNVTDTTNMLIPYLRDADSTNMLIPYLRDADTTSMLLPYLRDADTTAMLANYRTGINEKLNILDTTSMLSPYLRRADTTSMLLPYLRDADTTAMLANYRTGINEKLNILDTTSMLSPYLRRADTMSMLLPYLRDADTTALLANYRTGINEKLNILDTTSMLSPYLRRADTTNMLLPYLQDADTTAMLANYRTGINEKLNILDTTSMLSPYLRRGDTTSMLLPYLRDADTTAMLANYRTGINEKLNKTDTTNMLLPYLQDADTTAMLANYRTGINEKLNILDTTSMLSTYLRRADTTNMLLPYLRDADTTAMLANYRTGINEKLNILDTTNMLVPYLRDADTTNMLVPYLRDADTTNMLNSYFKKSDTTSLNLTNRFNEKLNVTDFPSGATTGNIMFFNGTSWVNLAPGSPGQSLIISSSGIPTWGCIITNTAGTASSTPTLNAYSALTPITHSTSGATGIGTATGLPAGVSASWTANTITISGTPSSAGSFTYTIPLTGGCGSINATGSMTVNAVAATLTTTSIGSITATDASSGGNITVDGGASITARGVVWSTSTGPTVSLSTKTTDGTGTGTFTSTISGLTASTSYYVRAYATNVVGTSYGNEITFTTCTLNTAGSATSTTGFVNTAITPITRNTTGATGIGAATGLPAGVTASWSNNVITISGTPTATGSFTYTIPLTGGCGSVNATGTITVTVFTCATNTVSDIDGNPYNTVLIGNQCWTKENLRVRRYNDGTWIRFDNSGGPGGNGSGQTWAGTGLNYGAHTIYANDSVASPSYLTTYGYLYNWYAAKGIASTTGSTPYKNICPTGWHVPTDSDWNKLVKSIHSGADTTGSVDIQSASAGAKLKKNDALWASNTGTDDYGFSALPGGFRIGDIGNNSFSDVRDFALFWSATEWTDCCGWIRYLNKDNSNFYRFNYIRTIYFSKSVGASVRCLKD